MREAILVRPAYGRCYSNEEEIRRDWQANLDFACVNDGQTINRRSFHKQDIIVFFQEPFLTVLENNEKSDS